LRKTRRLKKESKLKKKKKEKKKKKKRKEEEENRKRRKEEEELIQNAKVLSMVEKDLECPICLLPLWNPVIHSCGNMFCSSCIEKVSNCPLCRNPIGSPTKAPLFVLNRTKEIRVECPNCKNNVERGELVNHYQKCPQDCKHGCNVKVAPIDFSSHEDKCNEIFVVCPAQRFKCSWNGARKLLETHKQTCSFYQLLPILSFYTEEINLLKEEVKTLKEQLFIPQERKNKRK